MYPARVEKYLCDVAQLRTGRGQALASLIVFGSAARGAFQDESSDVDLIVVLPDGASGRDRRHAYEALARLGLAHGLRTAARAKPNALERFAEHAGGHARAGFVCTRSELLSGDIARIFHLRAVEAFFVDRIVLASVLASAVTFWGAELLPRVPLPAIRRLDVFKAWFNLQGMICLNAAGFLAMPFAARYAMGALKHSLHSCYFCYWGRTDSLETEVDFFRARIGRSGVLLELLAQRREYRPSIGFVLRCWPMLVRLHVRTARDAKFG